MAKRKSPKQRKEERQQEKRRGQQTIIIGVIVVIVIFAAIIFTLTNRPGDAPIPEDLDRYDTFITSTTNEGYPMLGNPNAPVTVREYASFSCTGCLDFHQSVYPALLPRVASGQINFVYVPLQTGTVPNQEGAARTAICAGEQGKFWQMHDVLFFWHETFLESAFQDNRIRTGVEELGLDVSAFNQCFRSNATNTVLSTAVAEGIDTTPTIEVNGAAVTASLAAIETQIENNIGGQTSFEPGVIQDTPEDTDETEESDASEEMEATEEVEASEQMEATEEADAPDNETEMTEEAEATEDSE